MKSGECADCDAEVADHTIRTQSPLARIIIRENALRRQWNRSREASMQVYDCYETGDGTKVMHSDVRHDGERALTPAQPHGTR